MSENKDRDLIPSGGGIFNDLATRIKLILRLMGDSRVSPLLKLLPIGSLAYFVIPDIAIGPIDDVAIVWIGSYLFVELCPPNIVQEHMDALQGNVLPGKWPVDSDTMGKTSRSDDVIDGEFWEPKN